MELVSVIIPIYKAENYLDKCLKSVVEQTYRNIEIILVNDGSPDGSSKICNAYAKSDSRIKVIHKKNGGVSSARNKGIELSTGKYVCFVDSDDAVHPKYIESLLFDIKDNESDLVVCSIKNIKHRGESYTKVAKKTINVLEDREEAANLINEVIMFSPWNKLYKKNIISENNISFDETIYYAEDTIFVLSYLIFCKKISFLEDILYLYHQDRMDSATRKFHRHMFNYVNERFNYQKKYLENIGVDQDYLNDKVNYLSLYNFKMLSFYYLYADIDTMSKIVIYRDIYNHYKSYFENHDNFDVSGTKIHKWYLKFNKYLDNGDIDSYFNKLYKKNWIKMKLIRKIYERIIDWRIIN